MPNMRRSLIRIGDRVLEKDDLVHLVGRTYYGDSYCTACDGAAEPVLVDGKVVAVADVVTCMACMACVSYGK